MRPGIEARLEGTVWPRLTKSTSWYMVELELDVRTYLDLEKASYS